MNWKSRMGEVLMRLFLLVKEVTGLRIQTRAQDPQHIAAGDFADLRL